MKVFALTFAIGVVSGITMSFQFGTNWPGFMESVGNIAGPLLAYEIMTAFFLEAVFLGIMLFGFRRVPGWAHTGATFLVAFGTTMSAFWILVLNSWMHTPQGFEMRDGVAYATDWFAIIFNPSMPYRLSHMLLASGLTVAFLIAGVSALRWIMGDRAAEARKTFRTGVFMAAVLIPVQIFAGDMHGLNTLEHQPAKVAAMEGNWETRGNVPLVLFALPNEETRSNDFEISIPNGASLILKHSADGEVPGLNDFVAEDGTRLAPARRARLLVVPGDGRHGHGDAVPLLGHAVVPAPGPRAGGAARAAALGFRAHGVLRLGRDARRLVHHRDRASALARERGAEHGRRRRRRACRDGDGDAGHLARGLCRAARRLSRRAPLPRPQAGGGRRSWAYRRAGPEGSRAVARAVRRADRSCGVT